VINNNNIHNQKYFDRNYITTNIFLNSNNNTYTCYSKFLENKLIPSSSSSNWKELLIKLELNEEDYKNIFQSSNNI
jgi:hypothetical protein